MLSNGRSGALWSSKGGGNPCITAMAAAKHSGKTGPELKNRNDFNNCSSPRVEKLSNRKPKDGQREGQIVPANIPKITLNDKTPSSKQLPNNGIEDSSELHTDTRAHQSVVGDFPEHVASDRPNKIPVNRVKPHPNVPGYSKPPSSSSFLKASVRQKQSRQEQQVTSRGQYRPRSPCGSLHSPQTSKRGPDIKQNATQAHGVSSPTMGTGSVVAAGQGASVPPFNVSPWDLQTDGLLCTNIESTNMFSKTSVHNTCISSSPSDGFSGKGGGTFRNAGKMKEQKYRPKDHVVTIDEQAAEESKKTARLKDKRLSFDPETGQIMSSFPHQEQEIPLAHKLDSQCSEWLKPFPPAPSCPFQQTDWKMLARSEIVQSYLSQQSSVLASSGAHTPGTHFFMTEFLKKEEHQSQGDNKTHTLAPEVPTRDLPGISREITTKDLNKLHTQNWSGVNGCYDTKGNWFDWTDCISLDPHADESRLNILPYVCLD